MATVHRTSSLTKLKLLVTPLGENSTVGRQLESNDCRASRVQGDSSTVDVDKMMMSAYGECLVHSGGEDVSEFWHCCWKKAISLSGMHYDVPGGPIGRRYVDLLNSEVAQLGAGNYSAERLIVFSSLMLQRDRGVKKMADVRRLLERRMGLWESGEYDLLFQEALRCDKLWKTTHRNDNDNEHIVKVFTRLMLRGKVRAAVRWLSEKSRGGVLSPKCMVEVKDKDGAVSESSVWDVLSSKHPDPQVPCKSSLVDCSVLPGFEDVEINGGHVLRVARMIQGGAGPGGCDSCHWQDCLLRFGAHSERLRDSVASLCRRLTNTIVPWNGVRALMSSRLIALDKCPGVRPIGVGETLRRVIGKVVCSLTRLDVAEVCGASQLCAGLSAGIEGAVHALNELFDVRRVDGWGILMVDAKNAFNSLNRCAALWNVRVLWPRCSRFLFNSYRGWSALVVRGSDSLMFSKEGVTQGDPLSMFLYAVSTVPLISSLQDSSGSRKQVWYADDASACGEFNCLRDWFDEILVKGPRYGYFPEPSKSFLVVDESCVEEAQTVFEGSGVNVVVSRRLLGGIIGCQSGKQLFVEDKVKGWVSELDCLTMIAGSQPQAAFAAFTKSMQAQWNYLQRVVPGCQDWFGALEEAIWKKFLPAVMLSEVSEAERALFSLPARWAGLGISIPTETGNVSYLSSRSSTDVLVKSVKNGCEFVLDSHLECLRKIRAETVLERESFCKERFESVIGRFDGVKQRAVLRGRQEKVSNWLTVLPLARHHFDLSAQEFRDALAIRYKKPLICVPDVCDGCGAEFTLSHALSCRKGGLVIRRHNEVRDSIGDLASLVWSKVWREPIVRDADYQSGSSALVADLGVRGVWLPQAEALFDVRIVDTDAQSYRGRTPKDVLKSAEKEKKAKYGAACEERHALFTPLCCSVDGMLGGEAEVFVKVIGERLASKWDQSYSEVMGWIRSRLSFAILRSSILCIRGSRSKWRCLGIEDGAPLRLIMN